MYIIYIYKHTDKRLYVECITIIEIHNDCISVCINLINTHTNPDLNAHLFAVYLITYKLSPRAENYFNLIHLS